MNKRKETEKLMVDLLYLVAQDLYEKIASGEATTQEINAAIKLLHNNGISVGMDIPESMQRTKEMLEELPQFDEDYVN